MSSMIGLCLTGACLLFVVSLPLGGFALGTMLRKWALSLLVLALAPAVLVSILREAVGSTGSAAPSGGSVLAGIGFLAILSVGSYLVLAAKGLAGGKKREASDRGGKRGGYRLDDQDSTRD